MDSLQDIKTVELYAPDYEQAGGIHVDPYLIVTWQNGDKHHLPNDPRNRHYQLVAEWYKNQDEKPFVFEFNTQQ